MAGSGKFSRQLILLSRLISRRLSVVHRRTLYHLFSHSIHAGGSYTAA